MILGRGLDERLHRQELLGREHATADPDAAEGRLGGGSRLAAFPSPTFHHLA